LKSRLEKNPQDYRSRAILIGTLLKIDGQSAALAELQTLSAQTKDSAAKPYFERASLMVSNWQKQQEGKERLLADLRNYSYADANLAVDQLSASAMQKTVLHMLIDSYAGRFDAALARASQLETISFTDKQHIEAVKTKVVESQKNYNSLMDKIDFYLYSPAMMGSCAEGEMKQYSISGYLDLMSQISRLAPLSERVMNLAFHATLLSSKYDELQALGDKILAGQGAIRIPFYSADKYFAVVIDDKAKSIYSQPDSHPFELECEWGVGMGGFGTIHVHHNVQRSSYLADFVAFNLPFDQIRGISQKAGPAYHDIGLEKRSYALAFDPAGVAPNYGLMQWLYGIAGAEAGLQATHNLGQFLLHVIGNPNLKAQLVDPKKIKHGGSGFGFGDALVALYGVTNGRTPLGAAAVQMIADDKAKNEMVAEQQQATWQGMLARDYSDLLNGSVFESLDKLIAVTQ
jgi:hypothetical protein